MSIFYFAGHGTAQGARFYLVPHDLGYLTFALIEEGLKKWKMENEKNSWRER